MVGAEQMLLFREAVVTTEFDKLSAILMAFGVRDRVPPSILQNEAHLSESHGGRACRDAKLLGLVENGSSAGLRRTELGKQWEYEVRTTGRPSSQTVRAAALNVPAFARVQRDLPGVTDGDAVLAYFCKTIVGRRKDLGSARRRYLEAFYGLALPRALSRTKQIGTRLQRVLTPANTIPDAPSASRVSIERELQLEEDYRVLVRTYGAEAVDRYHSHLFKR